VTDVCSLLSVDEAATALGSAPMGATPGEEPDEASGGTIRFCTYLGQGTALVVSVVETDSADAAAAAAQAAVAAMQEGEVDAQLSSETGLGESATWVVTPQAAGYTVVSGARAFSVSLGGPGIGDPAAHQAALRALAETLAGRL
jgi:hypothetical protein